MAIEKTNPENDPNNSLPPVLGPGGDSEQSNVSHGNSKDYRCTRSLQVGPQVVETAAYLNNGWIVSTPPRYKGWVKKNGISTPIPNDDTILRVWDITTGKCIKTLEGHITPVTQVGLLKNGQVVSISFDQVRVWDVDTGKCAKVLQIGENSLVKYLKVLPNDQVLIVTGNSISIWNIDKEEPQTLKAPDEDRHSIEFADMLSDGSLISIACPYGPTFNKTLILGKWDLNTGACVKHWTLPFVGIMAGSEPSNKIAITSDNLLVGATRKELQLWDISTGICVNTLPMGQARCVKALGNSHIVAVSSEDKQVSIWDLKAGRLKILEYKSKVDYIHVLSSGRFMTVSENGAIKLWVSSLVVFSSEAEIRKNTRTLHQFVEPTDASALYCTGVFSKLPPELTRRIISYTRDSDVHTEEEAKEIISNHSCKPT